MRSGLLRNFAQAVRQAICFHGGEERREKVWVVDRPGYREFGYDYYCQRCGKLLRMVRGT